MARQSINYGVIDCIESVAGMLDANLRLRWAIFEPGRSAACIQELGGSSRTAYVTLEPAISTGFT